LIEALIKGVKGFEDWSSRLGFGHAQEEEEKLTVFLL
jgi:hypothetical protein